MWKERRRRRRRRRTSPYLCRLICRFFLFQHAYGRKVGGTKKNMSWNLSGYGSWHFARLEEEEEETKRQKSRSSLLPTSPNSTRSCLKNLSYFFSFKWSFFFSWEHVFFSLHPAKQAKIPSRIYVLFSPDDSKRERERPFQTDREGERTKIYVWIRFRRRPNFQNVKIGSRSKGGGGHSLLCLCLKPCEP